MADQPENDKIDLGNPNKPKFQINYRKLFYQALTVKQ